ncbi:4'-phosphopantetheinyl transferase superfamily protein [Rhodobacteraceae bacterium B1Z28]|uniref:Enterobactin synthase component D n=1 Tax=Ruegeria haliotis TaxID=2747601 RepID=A0ABX2PT56_9RHOB|nr:4'-phosphopantetheinyl transferase superfamily protein [Ruegeria haliotis]NVO57358.1 4'-phosphopantetheinyl transferase superfamily protein [Ruegeria haliotis]
MLKTADPIWYDQSGFLPYFNKIDVATDQAIMVLGPYRSGVFRKELFAHFNVPFPDSLQNAVDKRRAEYLAGRLAVKYGFRFLNLPDVPIAQRTDRAPIWPHGISGSISHTCDRCASLIYKDPLAMTGVDIEKVVPGPNIEAIRGTALNSTEVRVLSAAQTLGDDQKAVLVFSAKESLFKALYPTVGRFFGFDSAELASPPCDSRLQLVLTADIGPSLRSGMCFEICYKVIEDHILTWLCTMPAD